MAALHPPYPNHADPVDTALIVARERQKSLLLRAWIFGGLFFMALPGTLLGFSNLVAISSHHGLAGLPPAWLEGHGHAQVFGWIGSFILGIGFYSQPSRRFFARIQSASFALWIAGVAMRWAANIYGWEWRILLPVSAGFELIAVALFLRSASQHKLPKPTPASTRRRGVELWMISVLMGTAGLAAAVIFNLVECLRLAQYGSSQAFPRALDQKYLLLLGWGFVVPTVWGFSGRWFSALLSIPIPDAFKLRMALMLDLVGLLCGLDGLMRLATAMLALSAVAIVFALRLLEPPKGPAKVRGIHPSFPFFLRSAYVWLVIASGMNIWAAQADVNGGIWGASRHALTVGFAATMVFAIGPRILPHFAGARAIFSKRLMFFCLLLLQAGCTLRVFAEPLAYEGLANFGWKALPFSGMLELSAVLLFAFNLSLTLLLAKPAWKQESSRSMDLTSISLSRQ